MVENEEPTVRDRRTVLVLDHGPHDLPVGQGGSVDVIDVVGVQDVVAQVTLHDVGGVP